MKLRYDIVALVSNDLVTDRRMQRCLGALAAVGYRCMLAGRERPQSPPLDQSLPFDQYRHRLQFSSGKAFYAALNLAHFRLLRRLRPRAVLVTDLDTMLGGAEAAARLGIPWVYDAHELFCDVPELVGREAARAVWRKIGRRYIPGSRARYTVGPQLARVLEERYGPEFAVVRNAPPYREPQPDKLRVESRFRVLYQGALNVGRGLEELLEVAQLLPQVDVVLAGEGDLSGSLRERARMQKLQNVTFLGQVDPRELPQLTSSADLGYALLQPLGLSYRLSLSNKSLDYIQARLPSLQSSFPEYEAINQEFGCYALLPEPQPEQIVRAILELQQKPTRYRELKEGCNRAAEVLNWEHEAAELLRIWRRVLLP